MTPHRKSTHAALSDIGRVRSHNEDAVLVSPPLFVVADGLGGHEAGEVASRIAVETLRDNAPRRPDANALARAVRAANKEVIRAAQQGIGREGMGTTITAAIVEGTHLVLAQVGDSRAYLVHGGSLTQITNDHSMVADLIRSGQLTEAESRVHPNRSVITRALGTDPNMYADTFEIDAMPGDRLLLCSDGLTGMLTDDRIAELLTAHTDPGITAHDLVNAANDAGGQDNISVIVVDIVGDSSASRGVREDERRLRGWVAVFGWLLALLMVVGGVGYASWSYARSRAFLIADPDGTVGVYRGVPGELAGIELKWFVESATARVEDLPPATQAQLIDGIRFDGVDEARAYARSLDPSATP